MLCNSCLRGPKGGFCFSPGPREPPVHVRPLRKSVQILNQVIKNKITSIMWFLILLLLLVAIILMVYILGRKHSEKMGPFSFIYEDLSTFGVFKLGCVIIKLKIESVNWTYEFNKYKILAMHSLRRLKVDVINLLIKMKNKVVSWFQ